MSTQSDHRSLTEFSDLAEFTAAEGTELGPTDWLLIDQARIDQLAQATTIEVEGSDKPAAVIESVVRYVA
jgi:hypothetical protein